MSKIIIGIGAQARVGKDTIADYLVKEYGFRKTSMASSLKEGIGRGVFGFNDEQLYGNLKEVVDKFWDDRLNIHEVSIVYLDRRWTKLVVHVPPKVGTEWYEGYNVLGQVVDVKRLPITPRLILQLGGTEAGRKVFGDCLWVETVNRRIQDSGHSRWTIPDIR